MPDAARANDTLARLLGRLFALVGLGLILGACAEVPATRRFVRSAARAPGVVTRPNAGGAHPQIQFTAASGEVVGYPQGGMIWGYHAGGRVSVLGAVFTGIGLSRASGDGRLRCAAWTNDAARSPPPPPSKGRSLSEKGSPPRLLEEEQLLEQALATYKAALEPALRGGTLFEFPLAPMDRLGLPLWNVALIGEDGALSDGFGYGPTLEAAQTSAWGEAVEWWGAREALKRMPRITATYANLKRQGRNAVAPVSLCLSAGGDYDANETLLTWVEAQWHPSGGAALVPIEFAAPRMADIGPGVDPASLLAVPITNGLGAGPTFAHALAHGILELLQRDGNSVHYRALDRGIVVDLDDVRNPDTRALLSHLDAEGIEIIVKLASDDFGLANLYVVGYDRDVTRAPQPIMLSACGEAVHPDREVALAKALREYTSARARKAFNHGPLAPVRALSPPGYLEAFKPASMRSEDDRALREMRGWMSLSHQQFFDMLAHPIYDVKSRVKFSELPTTEVPDAESLLALLTERLGVAGLDVLYADFTPSGSPTTILKAIVPGLEVETMTYQRIGGRNLRRLLAQSSPIVGVSDPPPGARPIRLTERDADLAGAWLDPSEVDKAMGPLYALYREPGRHVLGFLEETSPGASRHPLLPKGEG